METNTYHTEQFLRVVIIPSQKGKIESYDNSTSGRPKSASTTKNIRKMQELLSEREINRFGFSTCSRYFSGSSIYNSEERSQLDVFHIYLMKAGKLELHVLENSEKKLYYFLL